jgi:hypothetical protein
VSQRIIDFGSFPDDPGADAIRTAFQKVQQNFTELYTGVQEQGVASVNNTPGAGITVTSPTGNVVISANIACVRVSSSTLAVGRDSNNMGEAGGLAVISRSSQLLVIDLPSDVSNINNINLSNTLTAVRINADVVNSIESFNGNVGNFSGNLSANNITVTNQLNFGNLQGNIGVFTGNLSASNLNSGNLTLTAQLTGVTANFTGNITAGNANLGNAVTANFFLGDGGLLSNLSVGTVSNADHAVTANTVVDSSQPNITSVGTLVDLGVSGNIVAANITANTGVFTGNGSSLTNLNGANVTGTVANATFATTAGTVTANTQSNITSVGTLTSLTVSGNVNVANVTASGYHIRSVTTGITAAGTVQANATALTTEFNVVSASTPAQGVRLPVAVAGMAIIITNTSANATQVYPASGAAINTLSSNNAFLQDPGSAIQFIAVSSTQWYTVGATYA